MSRAPVALMVVMAMSDVAGAGAAPPPAPTNDGPFPGFLRLISETRGFMLGRPQGARATPDSKSVLFLRSPPRSPELSLFEFDVATGHTRELLAPAALLHGGEEQLSAAEKARRERMRVTARGFTSFDLSENGHTLIVTLSGHLYAVDRSTTVAGTRELPTGDTPILDPRLSPDGKRIAFVRDRDLYVLDLGGGQATRLTQAAGPAISNGLAEFVAQEEMERFAGYWWSPDGTQLAFEEVDNRAVETLRIADPAHPEREPEPFSYPRPGKANAIVRVGVVAVSGGAPRWIEWDAARLPYLASVVWKGKGPLSLVVMSREQQDLEVLAADPKTGQTRRLLAEHDDAWINLDQSTPRWLDDGHRFLWSSDRGGTRRLELRDDKGALKKTLGPADAEYLKLLHIDDKGGAALVLASPDPTEDHVYRVPLDGKAATRLTPHAGAHTAVFTHGATVFPLTEATLASMPRTVVRHVDGASAATAPELPSVAESPPFTPAVEIVEVGAEKFRAALIRPRSFDKTRRYPVILDVYGGPHHNSVSRAEPAMLHRQWIADHGYIVVAIDGRGTPRRGRAWERAIRGNFAKVTLDDQAAALAALGARFPEMDLSRTGVVGWSFGGYMSALAVMRRPDVFRVGVAGAPVVDWRDYDTCYTERYLGLPDANPEGYRDSSLLTHAASLSRPLLLIHGTADDNVYFLHSLKLADALLRAGKTFEMLPLVGFTHMVPDATVREQMWTRVLATLGAALHPEMRLALTATEKQGSVRAP